MKFPLLHREEMKTSPGDFSDRELRDSGLPPAGSLGEARKEVWALAFGIGVLVLLVLASIIDTQL